MHKSFDNPQQHPQARGLLKTFVRWNYEGILMALEPRE